MKPRSVTEFENHLIEDADFDIQEAYIKVLGVLINKFDTIADEQQYIIDCLAETIQSDMDGEEYIEEAEDMDYDDISAFYAEIRNNSLSYNFVVDMLLIAKFGEQGDKAEDITDFCYNAIEALNIRSDDCNALYLLVRSIYSESESILDKFKELDNYCIELDFFKCYVENYAYI